MQVFQTEKNQFNGIFNTDDKCRKRKRLHTTFHTAGHCLKRPFFSVLINLSRG